MSARKKQKIFFLSFSIQIYIVYIQNNQIFTYRRIVDELEANSVYSVRSSRLFSMFIEQYRLWELNYVFVLFENDKLFLVRSEHNHDFSIFMLKRSLSFNNFISHFGSFTNRSAKPHETNSDLTNEQVYYMRWSKEEEEQQQI